MQDSFVYHVPAKGHCFFESAASPDSFPHKHLGDFGISLILPGLLGRVAIQVCRAWDVRL